MQASLTKEVLEAKRKEAQKLLEVDGLQQKQVSAILNISENTISKWAKDFNANILPGSGLDKIKYTKLQLRALRKEAARLIVMQGMTQKAVSAKLGISQNTVGEWAKKGKWKEKKQKLFLASPLGIFSVSDFEAYLRGVSKRECQAFKKHFSSFVEAQRQAY